MSHKHKHRPLQPYLDNTFRLIRMPAIIKHRPKNTRGRKVKQDVCTQATAGRQNTVINEE